MRVKGKGLTSKKGMGDLHAVLKVMVPDNANEEEKKLWESLSEKAKFNPRSEWEAA
jgi:curved DNA-binding protein